MKTAKNIGDAGEAAVARYLRLRGWRILSRNYRVKGGEIDIIARRLGTTAFVEVKTRDARYTERFGRPADAVDADKIIHLKTAIRKYVSEAGLEGTSPRADVAEVYTSEGKCKINYIKGAFML